jgi:hypothetical protein
MRPEGLGNLIKIIHLIGSRTRDLQVALLIRKETKENSMLTVRMRTIPTEGPSRLAKPVPTFSRLSVLRGQRNGYLRPLMSHRPEPLLFLQVAPHEADWTPFQTHFYSEHLVAPGIEPGTSESVASNVTTICSKFLCPNPPQDAS